MLAASTGFDAKRAATWEPHGFGELESWGSRTMSDLWIACFIFLLLQLTSTIQYTEGVDKSSVLPRYANVASWFR